MFKQQTAAKPESNSWEKQAISQLRLLQHIPERMSAISQQMEGLPTRSQWSCKVEETELWLQRNQDIRHFAKQSAEEKGATPKESSRDWHLEEPLSTSMWECCWCHGESGRMKPRVQIRLEVVHDTMNQREASLLTGVSTKVNQVKLAPHKKASKM